VLRNCHLRHVIKVKFEETRIRGRSRKQILDGLKGEKEEDTRNLKRKRCGERVLEKTMDLSHARLEKKLMFCDT